MKIISSLVKSYIPIKIVNIPIDLLKIFEIKL